MPAYEPLVLCPQGLAHRALRHSLAIHGQTLASEGLYGIRFDPCWTKGGTRPRGRQLPVLSKEALLQGRAQCGRPQVAADKRTSRKAGQGSDFPALWTSSEAQPHSDKMVPSDSVQWEDFFSRLTWELTRDAAKIQSPTDPSL